MNVVVVGMGYVGVPLAVLLAEVPGFSVVGLQRRSERSGWKINCLNMGDSPFAGREPGIDDQISLALKNGFRVTDDPEILDHADIIIITVQTPVDDSRKPRLDNITRLFKEIGSRMRPGVLVSLESTVPPGTTEGLMRSLLEESSGMAAGVDFHLVFSYERVTPGKLLYNIRFLPRVVGGITKECTEHGVQLYRNVCQSRITGTDCLTAETSKLIENSYRDVNIAFANESAKICEELGVNYFTVKALVNALPNDKSNPSNNPFRSLHNPGSGVGGHCLPKDSWLLLDGLKTYSKRGYHPSLIPLAREINDSMPLHVIQLISETLLENKVELSGSKIAVLGLAYKEETDDYRNSPTESLFDLLTPRVREIKVHDPFIIKHHRIKLYEYEQTVTNSDCLVVMTGHNEYRDISLEHLHRVMRTPTIVDGRNVLDMTECLNKGFSFKGIGIPNQRTIR